MDIDHHASSFLYTLNDYIMSFNMFSLCLNCYLEKDDDPKTDFMLSTNKTPLDVLAKFPRIDMNMAEFDPVSDDNLRFVHRFMWAYQRSQPEHPGVQVPAYTAWHFGRFDAPHCYAADSGSVQTDGGVDFQQVRSSRG